MDSSRGLAVKVGIFVVIGLIIFLWASLKSEGPGFGKKRYSLHAYFEKANGLIEGDPVTLAGVQIGKVGTLSFDTSKQKIKATLDIFQDYKIKKDSMASIVLKSIMGQKYIDVTFGSLDSSLLVNGDTIQTYEREDFEEVMNNIGDLTTEARELISSFNENQSRVLTQLAGMIDENRENVKTVTSSLANSSPKFESIVASVDKISADLADGKGTLGKLIANNEMYENVNSLTADLREVAGDAKDVAANMKDITSRVKEGKGTLGKIIAEDTLHTDAQDAFAKLGDAGESVSVIVKENRDGVKSIVETTKLAMPAIEETAKHLQEISRKIDDGVGTVGKLINDPALFDDTRRAITQIEQTFEENQEQSVLRTFLGVVFGSML